MTLNDEFQYQVAANFPTLDWESWDWNPQAHRLEGNYANHSATMPTFQIVEGPSVHVIPMSMFNFLQ